MEPCICSRHGIECWEGQPTVPEVSGTMAGLNLKCRKTLEVRELSIS